MPPDPRTEQGTVVTAAPGAKPQPVESTAAAVRAFGKYILIKQLAEGGMAQIFLAKQMGAEGFERNVVIKRMLQHLSSVPDFVKMFLDEARLAARLAHQNIIQINDLGLADGCYYICMEYLAGEDFSTVLRTAARRREYVPLGVVVRVIADAAHGLHFAHEFADEQGKPLNVVHRDVSPSNIFVTYQGQVKVLDFGIAKAESRVTNTTAGVVKGKYMYMAPEQARGNPVDRRADVFSLGVSLYEALTNVRPFARDNDLAILNAVLKCEFLPPKQVRPGLPPELEAVVLKALSPRLEDRYQTAGQMAADLERFIGGNTSASGSSQVATYLRQFFGEERFSSKTRIPTLASLAASGVDVPGFSNPLAPKTEPDAMAARAPDATRVSSAEVPRAKERERGVLRAGAFIALAVVVGVLAFVLTRGAPPAEVTPEPPKAVTPAPQPLPPEPRLPEPPPPEPVAPPVEKAKANERPPEPKRVKLTAPMIQAEVLRQRKAASKCLLEHVGELPAPTGFVNVTFTIVSSGKVSSARSDLPGTGVGRCLEAVVKRLRFPPHKDEEVTLTVPFEYERR